MSIVCLSVCPLVSRMKHIHIVIFSSQKPTNLEHWSLLKKKQEVLYGLFKEPILGPLKFNGGWLPY